MKKTIIIVFTLSSIAVNGWVGICYAARNTYFRPLAYELDETPGYRYQFREQVEHRETNPEQRHYFMAVELGGKMANDLYFPTAVLNGIGLLLIWRLGWNRRAEVMVDQKREKTNAVQ